MQSMSNWQLGDRVEQPAYGPGTIIELTDHHVVVHFDRHGRRKFTAELAVLTPISQTGSRSPSRPGSLAPGPRATIQRGVTDPGYENSNRQSVVRATDTSGSTPGERVYVLRCGRCGAHYGANASEIPERKCPRCMDGAAGRMF